MRLHKITLWTREIPAVFSNSDYRDRFREKYSDGQPRQKVKEYAEYRTTRTPAWYDRDNVTEEETLILTGDNAAVFREYLQNRLHPTSSVSAPP